MRILLAVLTMFSSLAYSKTIELTPENTIVLRNEINDKTVSKLQEELAQKVVQRGLKGYTLYLVLDSPGGSIDAGLNFIEFAKTIPNLETVTLFAASMASAIVEALPGKRNVTSTGILMFHRAKGSVGGQFESGELESRLDFYKKIVRNMEQINADRMSMTLQTYKDKVINELWILGKDAVKEKAADEVVSIYCSPALVNTKNIETFSSMDLFAVQVEFSLCPLIKSEKLLEPKKESKYRAYKQEKWNLGFIK